MSDFHMRCGVCCFTLSVMVTSQYDVSFFFGTFAVFSQSRCHGNVLFSVSETIYLCPILEHTLSLSPTILICILHAA